jgi:NADH:ubiquinone oxidoreductase subunit 4 (subunit M)
MAHVEASVSGSITLAAVLLKLRGYGLLRVSPILINFLQVWIYLNFYSISWWIFG